MVVLLAWYYLNRTTKGFELRAVGANKDAAEFAGIGVKKTIADYGVDEQYFLDTLDEMTEQAFNDQCTGANPRYPLMSEIKELYLDAYYGREPQDYAVC